MSAVNDPPAAADDPAAAAPRSPIEIDVLAYDRDVDLDPLSIDSSDSTTTRGGTVACAATCLYSPPVVWAGDDSFSYT